MAPAPESTLHCIVVPMKGLSQLLTLLMMTIVMQSLARALPRSKLEWELRFAQRADASPQMAIFTPGGFGFQRGPIQPLTGGPLLWTVAADLQCSKQILNFMEDVVSSKHTPTTSS